MFVFFSEFEQTRNGRFADGFIRRMLTNAREICTNYFCSFVFFLFLGMHVEACQEEKTMIKKLPNKIIKRRYWALFQKLYIKCEK